MKRKRDIEYTIQSKLQTANTRNIASSNSSSHSSYIITNDGVLYVWGALKYPFVCTNPKHIGRAFLASPTKKCRNIESMDGVIACAFGESTIMVLHSMRY